VRGKTSDKAYFESYGPGGSKSYARSWREFTFDPADILALHKALFDAKPKTLLDLGAANGALVAAFLKKGVDAVGIENSRYIHRTIADPSLKKRIALGDARQIIRTLPAQGFDVVIDCAAQYLPARQMPAYLKQLRRITGNLFCLLVEFKTGSEPPHQGVRHFQPPQWWKARLAAAGFKHVPGGDGFFYTPR
jgi:hypothetical protein